MFINKEMVKVRKATNKLLIAKKLLEETKLAQKEGLIGAASIWGSFSVDIASRGKYEQVIELTRVENLVKKRLYDFINKTISVANFTKSSETLDEIYLLVDNIKNLDYVVEVIIRNKNVSVACLESVAGNNLLFNKVRVIAITSLIISNEALRDYPIEWLEAMYDINLRN